MNSSKRTIIALFILTFALAVGSATGQDNPPTSFDGKIAFLQNGDVFVADIDGTAITAITKTGGKVNDFCFSPGLEYLAISKEVDGGDLEFVVNSIIVINLSTLEILAEIEPTNSLWPELGQWTARDKFVYYLSSGFDMAGFIEHDVTGNTHPDQDHNRVYDLFFAHFNDDRTTMLYTSDSGVGESFHHKLHVLDRTTGDSEAVARSRWIYGGSISHDKNTIIFTAAESSQPGTPRELMMLFLESDSLVEICSDSLTPIVNRRVSWSYGDSLIGFVGKNDVIVLTADKQFEVGRVKGQDHHWCDDNQILFGRGGNLYIHDLISKQEKLLVENATKPVFLKAAW